MEYPTIDKLLLVLSLFAVSYSQKESIRICVSSNEDECQVQNVTHSCSNLLEIALLVMNYSEVQTLHLLVSGSHYLNTSLLFNNNTKTVNIHGPSIIQCRSNARIQFSDQVYLSMKYLTVKNCNITNDNVMSVEINDTKFYQLSMELRISSSTMSQLFELKIDRCEFSNNSFVNPDPTATGIEGYALVVDIDNHIVVVITNTNFTRNQPGGIGIHNAKSLQIENCLFDNIKGTGILVGRYDNYCYDCHYCGDYNISETNGNVYVLIHNSLFSKNARALYFKDIAYLNISQCNFTDHISTQSNEHLYRYYPLAVVYLTGLEHTARIENSHFLRNYNSKESVVLYYKATTAELENVTIADNNCTGIRAEYSYITIYNTVNLARNIGNTGALQLFSSPLTMTSQSQLYIANNTALANGGGIYTTKICYEDNHNCFFRIFDTQLPQEIFIFSGNQAHSGGDIIFGGYLSNCSIELNGTEHNINVTDPGNIFWKFASIDISSDSAFADEPSRVVFCEVNEESHSSCSDEMIKNIKIYRGQAIEVSLMAVDNKCAPSVTEILAIADKENTVWPNGLTLTSKNCTNYTYFFTGSLAQNQTTIEFTINYCLDCDTVSVNVSILKCPIGYQLSEEKCSCSKSDFNPSKIRCIQHEYKLEIPERTWIGEKNKKVVVAMHCQHCRKEMVKIALNDSDKLCTLNRAGVLCGKCRQGFSLLLSGDKCGKCGNLTHRNVLLSILLGVLAIVLIALLFFLNLTVSTGLINALVFYSNVVNTNSHEFLPISDSNTQTHLQNVIRILSTFQAGMNLDFRISLCFFDHYNTYISAWSQFAYPIYIWLLILLIVCASRYSRRLAKLTASNIVPVLATLLLLSYAKLLTTSLHVFSYTEMHFVKGGNASIKVWKLDGSFDYLQGKHIPLFLMSILMTVAYIIPFTLLVLLGPLLQAKSHHRLLSWINKLKPLMDAFYGPYSNRYRYWPGILLLARVVLFTTFAITDESIQLAATTGVVIALLILWFILGQNTSCSPYQKWYLNYLELFFLLNLGIFSISTEVITRVSSKTLISQQALAVVMTGSAFVVFISILAYQTYCLLLRIKTLFGVQKVVDKFCESIRKQVRTTQEEEDGVSTMETENSCTFSIVAVSKDVELREPLLDD